MHLVIMASSCIVFSIRRHYHYILFRLFIVTCIRCIIGHVEANPSEGHLERVPIIAEITADSTDFVHTPGKPQCINPSLSNFLI